MIHSQGLESRQLGAVDITESPMPAPKATSVNEMPDAAMAPAITAGHCTYDDAASAAATVGGKPVALISTQPEEGQNGDDDDDKTNQINNAVHYEAPAADGAKGTARPGDGSRGDFLVIPAENSYSCRPSLRANWMSRVLIIAGALLIAAGLAWPWLTGIGLGRLPGDIVVQRGNTSFYFPVVTCIVVSVVLSLLLWIFRR